MVEEGLIVVGASNTIHANSGGIIATILTRKRRERKYRRINEIVVSNYMKNLVFLQAINTQTEHKSKENPCFVSKIYFYTGIRIRFESEYLDD